MQWKAGDQEFHMGLVVEVPITQPSGDAWHMDMLTWSVGSFVRFCLKISSIFKITHTQKTTASCQPIYS